MDVLFATPCYSKLISPEHHQSMVATAGELASRGVGMKMHMLTGNPFVDQARNQAVDYFMQQTTADVLFFVDDDVGFDHQVVPRVLSYSQDVVGGLVPKRSDDVSEVYHANALTGRMQDGLFECKELPTAFMRITRAAIERYQAHYPGQPLFRSGPYRDEAFIGEDIFFCRQWTAMGGTLWIDSDISFTHRGSHAWKGNFFDYAIRTGLLIQAAAA